MTTYYNDHDYIYDFPGPHKHYPQPRPPQSTEVVETSKEVIISDINGPRYKVQLESRPANNTIGLGFQVRVINCLSTQPQPMSTFPENNGWSDDYHYVLKMFHICVQRYDSLVKAETQDFDNVDLYASKVGYKVICPCCCLFCKWHCPENLQKEDPYNSCYAGDMPQSVPCMLRCFNPDNVKKFSFVPNMPHVDKKWWMHSHDGWQKLPWMDHAPIDDWADHKLDPIYPKVSPFGQCKAFEYAEWCKLSCYSNDKQQNES